MVEKKLAKSRLKTWEKAIIALMAISLLLVVPYSVIVIQSLGTGLSNTQAGLIYVYTEGMANPPNQTIPGIPAFPYEYMRIQNDTIANATTGDTFTNPFNSTDISVFPSIIGNYTFNVAPDPISVLDINADNITVGFHTAINITVADLIYNALIILNSYLTPP